MDVPPVIQNLHGTILRNRQGKLIARLWIVEAPAPLETGNTITFQRGMFYILMALWLPLITVQTSRGELNLAALTALIENIFIISLFWNEENAESCPKINNLARWGTLIGGGAVLIAALNN